MFYFHPDMRESEIVQKKENFSRKVLIYEAIERLQSSLVHQVVLSLVKKNGSFKMTQ